jgi:hypothetical protein
MEFDFEFNDDEIIGEYICPTCGIMPLSIDSVTVIFPPTGSVEPSGKVECSGCGRSLSSKLDWVDAFIFDRKGAKVEGFSFFNGPELTEEEIEEFKTNIESELDKFYEASQ